MRFQNQANSKHCNLKEISSPPSGLDIFSHIGEAKIYLKGGERCVIKTVYIDVLFLINFIINYLILFCTAHICSARIRIWRIALSAALGAVYAVLVFILPSLTLPVAKLLSSLIMVLIAFGRKSLFRRSLMFLASTLAFGGAVFALSFLLRSDFIEMTDGVYYIHTSLPLLFFSTAFAYFLLSFIFRRRISDTPEKICRIRIVSGEREVILFALRDTGNSLRTSKNAPIIICNSESLCGLFPDEAAQILSTSSPQSFPLLLDRLSAFGEFSLIPCSSVGADFSLLLTFRPDRIEFDGIADGDAIIALSPVKISGGDKYSAIY